MSSPNYGSDGSVYYHQWDLDKVITRLKMNEQVADSPFSMLSTNFSSLFPEYNQQQNKLLYVSNESGSSQLWIVNPDSSSRKQLTDFAHNTGKFVTQLGQPMDAIFCFHCMTMAVPAYIFMISK